MKNKTAVIKVTEALNKMKGFECGYSSKTFEEGYFLIEIEGEKFAVKLDRFNEKLQNLNLSDAVDQVKYQI